MSSFKILVVFWSASGDIVGIHSIGNYGSESQCVDRIEHSQPRITEIITNFEKDFELVEVSCKKTVNI